MSDTEGMVSGVASTEGVRAHGFPAAPQTFRDLAIPQASHGFQKRVLFLAGLLAAHANGRRIDVLDAGCGTGQYLAAPLAVLVPEAKITGIDLHLPSIDYARTQFAGQPNLSFQSWDLNACPERGFDVVICSEVLEHVDDVDGFLALLTRALRDDGLLVITVPNGVGPFEIDSFFWRNLVERTGVIRVLRRILRRERQTGSFLNVDSGHVNFFRWNDLMAHFRKAGLRLRRYEGRTFLAGPVIGMVIEKLGLSEWNAAMGSRLPRWAISGWMFVLERSPATTRKP